MSSPRKRRLAAILFADVVGYTAMMQQDESTAARVIHKFHTILKEQVKQYDGQIIQFYGDGCLSIFDSSVDAVNCSLSIQKNCHEGLYIPLRIGLHSGDIYVQSDNVFGDSVNVTSRIESMGVAGNILLSRKLRDEIKNHQEIQLTSLGNFNFKNVEEPIEVFAVANEGIFVPSRSSLKGKFKAQPSNQPLSKSNFLSIALLTAVLLISFLGWQWYNNPTDVVAANELTTQEDVSNSIAILPFDNINKNEDKDYIPDGLSDEVRGALASFEDIKVISRSSSIFYKNQNLPLVEVGQKLGVKHILTGQVQWENDAIIVKVELNNADKDKLIWSNPYRVSPKDLPKLKQQITTALTEKLSLKLTPAQASDLSNTATVASDIYDKWLKARHYLQDYTPDKMRKAYEIAQEIIVEDSSYASAYYILGYYHLIHAVWFGSNVPIKDLEKAKELFNQGLALDPKNALCYTGLSNLNLFYDWDFVKAEDNIQKSIQYGDPRAFLSAIMMPFYNGEFNKAEERLKKHKEVDPLSVYHDFFQGRIWFFQGKTERAKKILREGIRLYGLTDYYHSLGKVYLNTGDYQLAIATLEKGLQAIGQNHPPMMADLAIAYSHQEENKRANEIITILNDLYQQGKSGSPAFYLAQIYSGTGVEEKAFEWLEKSFSARETEMVWLKIEPQFEPIRSDERYASLINKVGFPQVLLN